MRILPVLALLLCSAVPSRPVCPGSVQVGGCSGTLVYRDLEGTWGVSAGHCSHPGNPVRVTLADGRVVMGEWVTCQSGPDLSLFRVATPDPAPPLAQVAVGVTPKGPASAMGLHGPKRLRAMGVDEITERKTGKKLDRSSFKVLSGKFRNGDSGAGVYVNGKLAYVTTHGEDDDELYACRNEQLVEFLKTHKKFGPAPEGADWGDKDRTREILELKRRLAELEKKLADVKQGPPGPAGRDGEDGKPGTAADVSGIELRVTSLEEWRSDFRATIRIKLRPVTGD